jgi:hypothetical protein
MDNLDICQAIIEEQDFLVNLLTEISEEKQSLMVKEHFSIINEQSVEVFNEGIVSGIGKMIKRLGELIRKLGEWIRDTVRKILGGIVRAISYLGTKLKGKPLSKTKEIEVELDIEGTFKVIEDIENSKNYGVLIDLLKRLPDAETAQDINVIRERMQKSSESLKGEYEDKIASHKKQKTYRGGDGKLLLDIMRKSEKSVLSVEDTIRELQDTLKGIKQFLERSRTNTLNYQISSVAIEGHTHLMRINTLILNQLVIIVSKSYQVVVSLLEE